MVLINDSQAQAELRPPGSDASPAVYLQRLFAMRHYAFQSAKHGIYAENANATLGQLWVLLEPALQIALFWFLFGFILDVQRGTVNFVAFLTVGQLVFRHSREGILNSAGALTNNASILRSFSFPRAVLPLSRVLNALLSYRYALVVMFLVLPIMGEPPRLSWLILLPLTLLQAVMNFGLGLLLARPVTRFVDLRMSMNFIFQLLFYASGVFFPIEAFVSRKTHGPLILDLFTINPFYSLVHLARAAAFGTSQAGSGYMLISVFAWTFGSLFLGFFVFLRGEQGYSGVRTVPISK
jgi:teichoic acid transport system permease protein